MTSFLVQLIVAIAVLVAAWYIVERLSPDPLITKICQILIVAIALIVVVTKLWSECHCHESAPLPAFAFVGPYPARLDQEPCSV